MPRRNSGCESFFSTMILVGLSVALVYWDYETFARLEIGLSVTGHLQQIWVVAMKMSLTYVWFSIPLLIFVAIHRCPRATDYIGRGVLFVAGPNLLAWNIVGSGVHTITPDSMCQKKEMCGGWGAIVLCAITWMFLYLLAGVCSFVLFRICREARSARRPHKPSVSPRTADTSMRTQLITHSSEEICTICLDHYAKGDCTQVLIPCKHQFHQKCLRSWLRYHQSCPVCRAVLGLTY